MKRLYGVLTFAVALVFLFVACESSLFEPDLTEESIDNPDAVSEVQGLDTNKLQITSRHPPGPHSNDHYEFVLSGHEIEEGWTTIQLKNQSRSIHFVYLARLADQAAPEGGWTREHFMEQVTDPYQEIWDDFYDREITAQEWDEKLNHEEEGVTIYPPAGGVGHVSGRTTGNTTMYLEEGTYVIECFILDDDGTFHTTHGMVEILEVTGSSSDASEPEGDLELNISLESVDFEVPERPGMHTIEINVDDPVGIMSAHLIRLDGGTDIQDLKDWIWWAPVDDQGYYAEDLRGYAYTSSSDNPGPQTFLGGTHLGLTPVAAPPWTGFPGESAYMHVNLRPGEYAWVSEAPFLGAPVPHDEGVLKTFTVSPPGRAGR